MVLSLKPKFGATLADRFETPKLHACFISVHACFF